MAKEETTTAEESELLDDLEEESAETAEESELLDDLEEESADDEIERALEEILSESVEIPEGDNLKQVFPGLNFDLKITITPENSIEILKSAVEANKANLPSCYRGTPSYCPDPPPQECPTRSGQSYVCRILFTGPQQCKTTYHGPCSQTPTCPTSPS